MSELEDLLSGRCYVILSDEETFDETTDCKVRFVSKETDDAREWGDTPKGYRDIWLSNLITKFLEWESYATSD